ncbi:Hypothetical predicted protein [Lecanosticta acicola]|uniref:Uncharacterized protein n=1 Tax=Lecanosticta acicola TaxID=111012 RepID=A0AAI9E9K5_9PEZI|nr:Hypothetical predicted protein [Lecanosticta acicola]
MSSVNDILRMTDETIADEVATNVTGPVILARHLMPRLLAKDTRTNFLSRESGLGFVPIGIIPTYCSSKAYTHHSMVAIRQNLQGSNGNVIEMVPPFVVSDLLARNEEKVGKWRRIDDNGRLHQQNPS